MTNIKIGDYGRFNFSLTKKGKKTPFDLCAEVIEFDGKYVLIRDNDDIEYLPKRSEIKSFLRDVKPTVPCVN